MKLILNNKIILINKANSFRKRLKGFMFQKNITTGLVFKTKCIHTFFMKENIDLIITDKNNKIITYYKNFSKNKIYINFKSYYIYELPNNSVSNLQIGDKIIIKED